MRFRKNMDFIHSFFGFGKEKDSMNKFIKFIKNPIKFFERNKEKEESLLDVLSFIYRIKATFDFLLSILIFGKMTEIIIIGYILVFLFAKIIAIVTLFFYSPILNYFVDLFSNKSNILAAKRIVTYVFSVNLLLSIIPSISFLTILFTVPLESIGIWKQYKLSFTNSLFISSIKTGIIVLILWLLSL